MDLADYVKIAESVDNAISLLETGDLERSLEVCRWIAVEIGSKSVHSGALLELIQPFIDHVDEHGMPRDEEERRRFIDYLRRYLGCLRMALDSILGRE